MHTKMYFEKKINKLKESRIEILSESALENRF